eukprot:m.48310 g.48310  ORF g.48310 m.48310 type:complete len:223 (+) comp6027_c0_seq1:1282-1950(+)
MPADVSWSRWGCCLKLSLKRVPAVMEVVSPAALLTPAKLVPVADTHAAPLPSVDRLKAAAAEEPSPKKPKKADESAAATPHTTEKKTPGSQQKREKAHGGIIQFPLTRVKGYMKEICDQQPIAHEAIMAVAKAAELFVEHIAKKSLATKQAMDSRKDRKLVSYEDLATTVEKTQNLAFLKDIVPHMVPFGSVKPVVVPDEPKTADGDDDDEEGDAAAAAAAE